MEEEVTVYREREILLDRTKQKPQEHQEKPLVRGSTDEEMIMRELGEPIDHQTSERLVTEANKRDKISEAQPELENLVGKVKEVKENEDVREQKINIMQPLQTMPQETYSSKYFSGFEFVEKIGEGGLCVVDHVRDRSGLDLVFKGLNRKVIARVLQEDPEAFVKAKRLLLQEAQTINKVSGKEYTPDFAMEAVDNEEPGIYMRFYKRSLDDIVKEGLSPREAISLFLKLVEPIRDLHAEGLALMDINPSQYRIKDNGYPVLVDWNQKANLEATNPSQSIVLSSVTDSGGKPLGTPLYAAPEQKLRQIKNGQEHLVDIFQLGSILYYLHTGKNPEGTHKPLSKISSVVNAIGEERAKKLDEIILMARSQDPTERQKSVDDLVNEVKSIVGYNEVEEEKENLEKKLARKHHGKVSYDDSPVELIRLIRDEGYLVGRGSGGFFYRETDETELRKKICILEPREPKKNWFGIRIRQRDLMIGELNMRNRETWLLQVYGRKKAPALKELARKISDRFDVSIDIILESELPYLGIHEQKGPLEKPKERQLLSDLELIIKSTPLNKEQNYNVDGEEVKIIIPVYPMYPNLRALFLEVGNIKFVSKDDYWLSPAYLRQISHIVTRDENGQEHTFYNHQLPNIYELQRRYETLINKIADKKRKLIDKV